MDEIERIRVLLVDDHEVVRQGLVMFLRNSQDIDIVGQCGGGEEAIRMTGELHPDVVLMDLVMPGMDGVEATRRIKELYPSVEVVALTSFIDDDKVVSALEAGVAGYVTKDVNPSELSRAIRSAASGQLYLSPAAARRLANRVHPSSFPTPPPEVLTEREIEVLRLIARGLSNQDIADDLTISIKTVKGHVGAILLKLGLNSRTQAALYALRRGLVPLED